MKLSSQTHPKLPALAWVASIDDEAVSAWMGEQVERTDEWLVEGVWDGDYSEGEFHRSPVFFGSGLRIDGNRAFLVPSNAVTDRLYFLRSQSGLIASNSLPLLLGVTRHRLRDDWDYVSFSYAIREGIYDFEDTFPLRGSRSQAKHLIHRPACFQSGELDNYDRTSPRRFENFQAYYSALSGAVQRIRANASSQEREHPMEFMTTLSSGYDSTCASVLARDAGASIALTVSESNSSWPRFLFPAAADDHGGRAAKALGLTALELPSDPSTDEIYFRSAACIEPDLAFDGISRYMGESDVGVVFTGYYGDTLWGISDTAHIDSDLRWSNPSGISVSEARLKLSFVNLAVPFIYGRSRPSISRISLSDEMEPWRLGGDYDRPVPRRIAEEAGIDREAFGIRKKAILDWNAEPRNRELRRMYRTWATASLDLSLPRYLAQLHGGKMVFLASRLVDWMRDSVLGGSHSTNPYPLWKVNPQSLMFRWAANCLSTAYSEGFPNFLQITAED